MALVQASPAPGDTRSQISADYQPWEFTVIKPVVEEIIEEIQKDQVLYPEVFVEPVQPIVAAGNFWDPTETPPPDAPTPTATLQAIATETPTSAFTADAPSETPTVTASSTPSPSPTSTPFGPPEPVPPAVPPANTYWFYGDTTPLSHMMYTTLASGSSTSSGSVSFHSPTFAIGQSLQSGTTTVNFYAWNPSPIAAVFSVELRGGATLLGAGTFALPPETYDGYFFSASFATTSYNFAGGERLEVSLSFASPAELYWDGEYNYSGISLPVIDTTPTPTASPTSSPSPTPSNTVAPTSTPTNTPVPPTSTPTNTPVPPTNTPTSTPVPPTNTPTNTPVPPTNTPTSTPVPPTNTPTNTPVPPTNTPTNTPVPPTATPTNTSLPPTNTPTSMPGDSPSVDATSTAQTTSSSVTFSHTTSGSNRLILVGVSIIEDPGPAPLVSSITYNTIPLASVGARVSSDGFSRIEIWQLIAPDTGTHNVVVTLGGVPDAMTVGTMTFTGVNQVTPLGTFASGTGDAASGSVDVTSAANELVFATMVLESTSNRDLVPGAGQTEWWDLFQTPATNGGGSTEPGAATVAMSWSWSGADKWVIGGVSIKP